VAEGHETMFQSASEPANNRDWQLRSLACATSCRVARLGANNRYRWADSNRVSAQAGLVAIAAAATGRSVGYLISGWSKAVPAMTIVSAMLGRLDVPSILASS
jgi:hypothetical protein